MRITESDSSTFLSSRPTTAFWVAWIAYCIVIIMLRPTGNLVTHEDFRCFYAAGVLVRTDPTQLYDLSRQKTIQDTMVSATEEPLRYVTPPFEVLRYLPFCGLPYRSAYVWVMVCNLAFIGISFIVAMRVFSAGLNQWELGPELLFFLFVPLTVTVTQGQGSILFLLLVCLSWREYERNSDLSAGFLLAFTLFKFTVSIPLAIFLIARRGAKFLVGYLGGAAAVTAISFWMVGLYAMRAFSKILWNATLVGGDSTLRTDTNFSPTWMPNLRGLIYGCGGEYLPRSWLLVITLLASALLIVWILRLVRAHKQETTAFGLAIVGALLLSYYLQFHDLTVLLLAVALLSSGRVPHLSFWMSLCWGTAAACYLTGPRFLAALPLFGLVWAVGSQQPRDRSNVPILANGVAASRSLRPESHIGGGSAS